MSEGAKEAPVRFACRLVGKMNLAGVTVKG